MQIMSLEALICRYEGHLQRYLGVKRFLLLQAEVVQAEVVQAEVVEAVRELCIYDAIVAQHARNAGAVYDLTPTGKMAGLYKTWDVNFYFLPLDDIILLSKFYTFNQDDIQSAH